ncbi:hypothetical protein VDGE_03343 [Verticillium dahliae]|uniref:Uncharacterized protein n=1 Tax=Verticillium dahliae TaxID=27337 RepID=A0A444RY48_VERDA|nr:hypothetical protein VDGE_03343 [Verticillium dahliae]
MASILVDEGKKYALNAAKKAAKDITGSNSKKKADKPLGDRDDPVDGLRRPKNRARGFVRAYAPVLNTAGIDQATFLDFVDTFNKSLEPNPYLNVINLAGFAGEAAPDPFSLLIGLAVDVGTYALLEADSRNRSSRFLDCINAGFFMPRGLACFCATWRSDAESQEKLVTAVDFEGQTFEAPTETDFIQQTRKAMLQKSSRDDMVNKLQQQIQERMKPCRGAFNWPEPAPLIFPSADETKAVMCTKPDGKPKGGFDRGEVWADNFSDRRAQAKWMQKNPGFNVAASMPKPEFKSRYADPNHPASSGDIVAFVTAGKWSTRGRVTAAEPVLIQASQDSDGERQKSGSGDERETRMATTTEPGEETEKDRNKKLKKEEKQRKKQLKKELELEKKRAKESGSKYSGNGFKSLFQKDVLYLIIIDIRPNPESSC